MPGGGVPNLSKTGCFLVRLRVSLWGWGPFPSPNNPSLKNYPSTSTEGRKFHENLAPVLVNISGNSLVFSRKTITSITAGFLSRAGAETPLNFREKFRVFPRTILENFSGVDTQTAVLVSTAEVWISAPDAQTPVFLGFLGIHS